MGKKQKLKLERRKNKNKSKPIINIPSINEDEEERPRDETELYADCPGLLEYINELKSAKMTLEQFRERFSQDLDIIEIEPEVYICSQENGKKTEYRGKALAVRYRGDSGPADLFAFPDADNPDAPVPPDVFDYLMA